MNLTHKYIKGSVEFSITGIPDYSLNQSEETLGILLKWQLSISNHKPIEGNSKHLEEIIHTINPYIRATYSGLNKCFVSESKIVSLERLNSDSTLMTLKSTKDHIEPLSLRINNAELADMTFCLDLFRTDSRNSLSMKYDDKNNYSSQPINSYNSKLKILLKPALAAFILLLFVPIVSFDLYLPQIIEQPASQEKT